MKKKYLLMLPAFSLATSTLSWGQAVADVPAAAKVNLKAEFTEAKSATDLIDKLAAMITKEAKEEGEDVDGKAILKALGLGDITSYAMSSEKDGTEWKNLMFLHTGEADKGIFSLIGKKGADFSAPNMCPAGSDLVMQMDLDLRTAEELLRNVMKAAGNVPKEEQQDFEDTMKEEIPELGMTTSALLSKLDVRVNIAIDLDDKVKLALPMVGELDKPRAVVRIDGLAWMWDKMGDDMIAESGMPLQKKEEGGVITYSLPAEMAAQFMGYSPVVAIDKQKNQIWISSSPEFLKRSMDGTESLADSLAYKGTMQGLPGKGNAMAYMSKDFADLLLKLHGIAKANGMMEGLGENKDDVDKMVESLKKINQGNVSTLSRSEDGLHFSSRSTESLESMIVEAEKQMQKLMKELK
ncbi:MAG: hypothetical protein ACI9E1_001702 [Cryomorphaceae bacterium]|jgi:hypothetical protein